MDPATILGAPPAGDPGALRQHAARVRQAAAGLRQHADQIGTAGRAMPFRAPAADRARADLDGETASLKVLAEQLDTLATHLTSSAGQIAGAQADWNRAADKLLAEARETKAS